jgi:hypothetical protein
VRDLAPLFVTGALEDAAADAVRDHLRDCDDPHLELLELGAAATALLETVEPAEPPVALKGRLMAAAEADLREGRHASTAASADASSTRPAPDTAPAPGPAPGPAPTAAPVVISAPGRALPSSAPARVVALDRARAARRPSVAWLAVAAAVIIAIALGGWNVALRGQLADAEAYRTGVDAALALASQPGSVAAVLVNQDGGSAGLGVVGADGTVRLALRGLVPTSGTQVYTAWGIAGDAAPVPLGDIRVGAGGTAAATGSSPMAQPGMVLALTLEPVGGAQSPTLPIVASGVAVAPAG